MLDYERLQEVFTRRQVQLRDAQFECVHAKYYVGPAGGFLYQQNELNNDLCIDTSSVRTDRPFEVDIAEYPFLTPPSGGIRIPTSSPTSYTLTVWAGERTRVPTFHHSLVRFTVRGYPSGVSLRMLALSGSSAAPASLEFSDLFLQQAQAAQAASERGTAAADAMDALADQVAADKSYAAKVKGLSDALANADRDYAKPNPAASADAIDPQMAMICLAVLCVFYFGFEIADLLAPAKATGEIAIDRPSATILPLSRNKPPQ